VLLDPKYSCSADVQLLDDVTHGAPDTEVCGNHNSLILHLRNDSFKTDFQSVKQTKINQAAALKHKIMFVLITKP